jgi:hypothetical protein
MRPEIGQDTGWVVMLETNPPPSHQPRTANLGLTAEIDPNVEENPPDSPKTTGLEMVAGAPKDGVSGGHAPRNTTA